MRAWLRSEIARAPRLYAAILVAGIAALAYANSLEGAFVFDDGHHIVENPYVRDFRYAGAYFTRPETFSALPGHDMYRPVVMLSLAWNYKLGGYQPLPWRLTAIALHCLATLGVFFTFFTLSCRMRERPARPPMGGALVAALFFALHPVFTETVNYASARASLLATVFVVWAFAFHGWARASRPGARRALLWTASLLLFALGLLSKEIAIVFPLLLLWLAFLERRGYAAILPALLVAALYVFVRQELLGSAVMDFSQRSAEAARADPGGGTRPVLWNLSTQARVVACYLALFAWPFELCLDRAVRVSETPFELQVLLGGSVIAVLLYSAWRLRRTRPLASMGLVWFFVALAPTSSILPLNQVMNERRLYLPGCGIAILLGGLWLTHVARPRRWAVPAAAAGCVLLLLTWQRNLDWRDPVRLWRSAVRVSPASDGAWNALGSHLRLRGEYGEAIAAFERSRAIDPRSWPATFNLGTLHLQRGHESGDYADLEAAERWLQLSLDIQPGSERSRWYLAETWFQMGRVERAENAFRDLAGLNPRLFEMTRYPLARIAADRGEFAEAEKLYRAALKEGRDPVSAYLGLAELAERTGDRRAAVTHASEAMEARPHSARPHLFLATLQAGSPLAARHLFEAERRGYRPTPEERRRILGGS